MARGPERWVFYRLVGRETVRTVRGAVIRLTAPPEVLQRAKVEALVIAPHDLRTSDASLADDFYSGLFVFAGRSLVVSGRSPFDYAPPSSEWAEELYGFGWLRHLRAADTALARANARAFVSDFLAGRGDPVLARPVPVAARRMISFLSQSPLVLEGADHDFYQAYLRAIGRGARDLERSLRQGTARPSRLLAAVALCYAGLCCDGIEAILRRATRILSRELDRQVLPDGGHRSRDPRFAMELMLDLLPLRQSFLSRSVEPPEALLRAIDRMLPILRLLRQGDASLSHFNGMGTTEADHLTSLLIYDGAPIEAMKHAPNTGYERLEGGSIVLVADVGAPPRHSYSARACAGCLSFEMSSGLQRIVVNCGAPASGAEMRRVARSTAAHSSATVSDTSSCKFLDDTTGWWGRRLAARWLMRRWGPIVLVGPGPVAVERRVEDGNTVLAARHDGYLHQFGVVHERRWRVASDGGWVEGEDAFFLERPAGSRPPEVAIRFHLHPAIQVSSEQGSQVQLNSAFGGTWLFAVEGADLAVEESVFLAGVASARRTSQIVIYLTLRGTNGLRWRFTKLDEARLDPRAA